MEMVLADKDLWDIVDDNKEPPPPIANNKDKKAYERYNKKAYERHTKKAFAIIATNLVDKELVHIKDYKEPTEA